MDLSIYILPQLHTPQTKHTDCTQCKGVPCDTFMVCVMPLGGGTRPPWHGPYPQPLHGRTARAACTRVPHPITGLAQHEAPPLAWSAACASRSRFQEEAPPSPVPRAPYLSESPAKKIWPWTPQNRKAINFHKALVGLGGRG